MQVLAVGDGAKVAWVESTKARHGRRFTLHEKLNSCLDLRALGGGDWSTRLRAGQSYELGLWADTASTTPTSFLLDMGAADSILQIQSGPAQGTYQYFSATQARWTGPVTGFTAGDYNGWSEAVATRPNWRKFTLRFAIAATASTAQIDSLQPDAGGRRHGSCGDRRYVFD